MSGGDGLSDFPEDLLRRVLYFAPAREGASTGALSKRWRGLWRSSGALNLDARLPKEDQHGGFFSHRDAFVSAARSSLQAAAADGSPVARLTFLVVSGRSGGTRDFLYYNAGWKLRSPDVVTELLSLPAARRVEELRLAAGYTDSLARSTHALRREFNQLNFLCLPSDTLRVLDVTSCGGLIPSPGVVFPRLASVRLSHCSVWIEHLQDVIHAAPALATLHLDSVNIQREIVRKGPSSPPGEGFAVLLHCPSATELMLDKCCWLECYDDPSGNITVKIDAARLRRFRYKGVLRRFELSSPAPDLAWVELHILTNVRWGRGKDAGSDPVTFWRLAQNFCNAKELKVRVNMLEDIAVVDLESQAKLLCSFRNLKRLQLEGMHKLNGKTAVVAPWRPRAP